MTTVTEDTEITENKQQQSSEDNKRTITITIKTNCKETEWER